VKRRSLSVLVAEDNKTNQKVVSKILERAGHSTTIVDNGDAAMEALTSREFDLVLMDINMPVLNGLEATKLIRFATLGLRPIVIIALTGDATPETRQRCLEAGMDDCLTKPIKPATLIAKIDAMFPPEAAEEGAAADGIEASEDAIEAEDMPSEPVRAIKGLDERALADLEELGGPDFVSSVVAQFVGDAAAVLQRISVAVAEGDVVSFRERAHALRSCAANVGARGLFDLCLAWRDMDARGFNLHGEEICRELETEFAAIQAHLQAYLNRDTAEASRKDADGAAGGDSRAA
jgi:two-component system sensor histidine kinase RpfC